MTRLVEHEATGPLRVDESDIDPEKGDIAVCRCGLSAEHPFCDGSHRATEGEGEGLYRYERTGQGSTAADLSRRAVERVVDADAEADGDTDGGADP